MAVVAGVSLCGGQGRWGAVGNDVPPSCLPKPEAYGSANWGGEGVRGLLWPGGDTGAQTQPAQWSCEAHDLCWKTRGMGNSP